jgi:hypothetical protein
VPLGFPDMAVVIDFKVGYLTCVYPRERKNIKCVWQLIQGGGQMNRKVFVCMAEHTVCCG